MQIVQRTDNCDVIGAPAHIWLGQINTISGVRGKYYRDISYGVGSMGPVGAGAKIQIRENSGLIQVGADIF